MYRTSIIGLCTAVFLCVAVFAFGADDIQPLPEELSPDLDYILAIVQSEEEPDPDKIAGVVDFIRSTPTGTSFVLAKRNGSEGAVHTFEINDLFSRVIGYSLNPDIPTYVTMPSSIQEHRWLTPEIVDELRDLVAAGEVELSTKVFRGLERETITPDVHTGGYYTYEQNRLLWVLPGQAGPIMISATVQADRSEIGRKGCVVGDDGNWDYLYLEQTGLTKTGLGWADTFMYRASSVSVYVSDTGSGTIRIGSFKWLNAGWSKMNMVKSHHILTGIKRFANDFKNILESPNLPVMQDVEARYQELLKMGDQELRLLVSPYINGLKQSDEISGCSNTFASLVSSGQYLEEMENQEIIRILLLEYLKGHLKEGSSDNVSLHADPGGLPSTDS